MPHAGVYIAPFGRTITKDGGGVQKKPVGAEGWDVHLWPFRPSGCVCGQFLTPNGRLTALAQRCGHLFRDHDGGRIGVAPDQARHDGRINHPQAIHAAHPT